MSFLLNNKINIKIWYLRIVLQITFQKIFISNKEIIDELKAKEEKEVLQIGKKKKDKQEIKKS